MPDQLKLGFYLWTRAAVVQLIAREVGVTVSLTTVGQYLKTWGLSAQKPVRRAYERNDVAIARRLKREYPAIARDAAREGATIYWGDEMGLRSDHVTSTSDALVGQTPVVRATGQRFGCSMISAITNRGHLLFRVFQIHQPARASRTFCSVSRIPTRNLRVLRNTLRSRYSRPSNAPAFSHSSPRSRRATQWSSVGRLTVGPLISIILATSRKCRSDPPILK